MITHEIIGDDMQAVVVSMAARTKCGGAISAARSAQSAT